MKPKAILGICSLAVAAFAQSFGDTITLGANNNNYRSGNGGEFNWIANGGNPDNLGAGYAATTLLGSGFESFCIQVNEHISWGGTYEYTISTSAKGPSGTDPISLGTAWLYSQFATGTLAGYNYTPGAGRVASAAALQNAIWYLEGEISNPGSNVFLTAANNQFGANKTANANGSFEVFALNLGPVGTSQTARDSAWSSQDQLIYRHVPEGGITVLMLGLGMLGLGLARRRA